MDVFNRLTGDADFVLIDCAAGLGEDTLPIVRAADEMITVTNPELPAVTDALKLVRIAEGCGTRNLGAVVNRIKNMPHELSVKHIEDFLNLPIIGRVYEDHNIGRSVAKKEPVVVHRPKSVAAQQFKKIAADILGEDYRVRVPVVHRLFGWLR